MTHTATLSDAVRALRDGEIIAYPTEAVFGIGCDPDNEQALQNLLRLKQRPAEKGLIIIAADIEQLSDYVSEISEQQWSQVQATWPGPVTWLMPAQARLSKLLIGQHSSIAVRVTAHPVASRLCKEYGKPIVSTSANIAGREPARSVQEVREQFAEQIAYIVDGEVDKQAQPSQIRDLLTNEIIRG